MKLIIDGRDLSLIAEKKEELKGIDLTVVYFEDINEDLLNELKLELNFSTIERFNNRMQMITYMKLQTLANKSAVYTNDNCVMFLISTKTKNYCDDLSLACKFVKGMTRLESREKLVVESTTDLKVIGLA